MRQRRSAPAQAEARDEGLTLETADGAVNHAHRASWVNRRGFSRYLAACVAATRPKSLTAAVIPFAVGTSLASAEGPLRWTHAVPAFVAFVLMQIGCNLVNDACDFLRGADGPARTGPTRVSQAGVFRAGTVHLCGVACLVLSAACMTPAALDLEYHTPGGFLTDEVTPTASTTRLGAFLQNTYRYRLKHEPFELSDVQWPIALLATFSIAAAYGYTGGPFPLAYHGLGDFTVIVFFGVVAVALARRTHLGTYEAPKESDGTYYSSHLTNDLRRTLLNEDALVAGAQTGALACVLLAVNNVRDLNTDKAANKKTLAVKYGLEFVKREIDVLLTFAFAFTWYWWFTRVPFSNVTGGEVGTTEELLTSTETNTRETRWSYASTAPCLTIPLALSVSRRARLLQPGHRDCDGVLAAAAALHFAFGGLLAVGIWLDGSMGAEGDTDRR